MENPRTVRGVHDILPDVMHKYNYINQIGAFVCNQSCYEQIDTPIFEFADLFIKPLGETSDIVTKENYIFKDKSNNTLMLRPEGTTSVVRAIINAGLTQNMPKRYFYFGPMFRYERPQKGRLRQFNQFGIELLGVDNAFGDIEVINLGYNFLKKLKLLNKVDLVINTLGDQESRSKYRDELVLYFNKYKSDLSEESRIRLKKNPLRILDSKINRDKEIIKNAPDYSKFLNKFSIKYFEDVCIALESLNIPFMRDPYLVRGLDYYSHTTFEFKTKLIGAQDTILAGGRYDGLSKMISNISLPGVGWAAGVERIALMIDKKYSFNPLVVLIPHAEKHNFIILELYKKLIDEGIRTEMIYSGSLNKKLKRANKILAKFAVIIGENEIRNNVVQLKNLQNGEQLEMKFEELLTKFKSMDVSNC